METVKYSLYGELTEDCPSELFEKKAGVAYGSVKHGSYHSNTCRTERPYSILLPPSYDGVKKFPVMYFQHGIFGDENCMINDAENHFIEITGNLCASGDAREMVIVFGHMYASDNPDLKPGFDDISIAPYDNFINELINDLMPHIEKNYSILTGKENTAICGFSMGGRESVYIGLQRPDLFSYIGAIAPAPGLVSSEDKMMKHKGMLKIQQMKFMDENNLPSLLMVCCGTQDSVVGKFPESYHKIFCDNKVEHLWFEINNADHNCMAIRTGLLHFVLRIFR